MVVVFDAVGTLIRTSRKVAEVYQDAGVQFGSHLTIEQVGQRFSIGRKLIFGTAGRDCTSTESFPSSDSIECELWRQLVQFIFDDVHQPDELFKWLWDYFGCPSSWQLFDDTTRCLEELENANYRVCIGSNFDSRIVRIFAHWLPELPILNLHWSSKLGCRKPDHQFYRKIEGLHQREEHFVMVGDDRINDYEAPLELGWNAILLDRHESQAAAVRKVANLSQLAEALISK